MVSPYLGNPIIRLEKGHNFLGKLFLTNQTCIARKVGEKVVAEIFIRYVTTNGLEKTARFSSDETGVNLDLRNIAQIDLLPLIWCEKIETLCLRNNSITEIDLYPLEKSGKNLRAVILSHNRLQEIDLGPLSACPNLEEVSLLDNRLKRVDLSPLFHCPKLKELKIDNEVGLTADLLLRSVGSWPEVLIERYHRILWKADTSSKFSGI